MWRPLCICSFRGSRPGLGWTRTDRFATLPFRTIRISTDRRNPMDKPDNAASKVLWGGRFDGGMDPRMVPLNLSLSVDRRLWPQDVHGSRAWARALGKAGVLSQVEVEEILAGLTRVEDRLAAGPEDGGDEDIHSLVERLLGEEAGAVAGKLHTGRSRNDQVATDFRLWGMEACDQLIGLVDETAQALIALAEKGREIVMPGYTHMQQGQPILASHWALSSFWPLMRDRDRLRAARRAAGVLPLGSGALAGCPFPIDRDFLAAELGFHAVTENSLDAISDRDWAADLLYASAMIGLHISRIAEDLVYFSSREFGFIRLSDGFSTGSSLMPQKRNPDAAELTRGKSGRLVGNLSTMLTLLKGLPTGYNRDLQEDKPPVFDSVDTLLMVLPALAGAIETAEFRPDRIEAALDHQLLATDLADYLVRKGVPFRTCHEVVGALVKLSEDTHTALSALSVEQYAAIHPDFGEDVLDVFDWTASVSSRASRGGTAPESVSFQMEQARRALQG